MAIIIGVTGDNPLLQGTTDADEIFGNSAGTIDFTAGNDRIFGRGGDDVITGDGVTIAPDGRGGDDFIQGGDGWDYIYGDASTSLYGIGGNDTIYQNVGLRPIIGDARTWRPARAAATTGSSVETRWSETASSRCALPRAATTFSIRPGRPCVPNWSARRGAE